MSIDLTLAVNYIPAVVCLFKAALISFGLAWTSQTTHFGAFTLLAMLLHLDRAVASSRILDENAVQMAALVAWLINHLRAASPDYAGRLVDPVVSALWVAGSLALVVEPKQIQDFLSHSTRRLLPASITCLFVWILCFVPMAVESALTRSARIMAFSGMCVAWTYIVSIRRARQRCLLETYTLLSRFCPVLYVHAWLSLTYSLACLACLVYHYYILNHCSGANPGSSQGSNHCTFRHFQGANQGPSHSRPANECKKSEAEPEFFTEGILSPVMEDEEDVEAIFRSCQNVARE